MFLLASVRVLLRRYAAMSTRKRVFLSLLPIADVCLTPLVYPAGLLMKAIRRAGVQRMPRCREAFRRVGVFPIRDHYYEPQFSAGKPRIAHGVERELPGINWNSEEQLALLDELVFGSELRDLPQNSEDELTFRLNNYSFSSGDAEFWYNIIRLKKPRRIIEIGSGHSTLMAAQAVRMNQQANAQYVCEHVCIEPYEMPWLEKLGITVLRQKVEDVDLEFFKHLEKSDILFIDSSHMIRPDGDVLFEFLELLPRLPPGVIVHVHDIFSPRNYPRQWLEDEVRFWNEQYLLEAFLTENPNWRILGAVNWLKHNHFNKLKLVAPSLSHDAEPASFYMQRL